MSIVTKETISLDGRLVKNILKTLEGKCDITTLSKTFAKHSSNYERVSFVYDLLKKDDLLPDLVRVEKCDKKALEQRFSGNYAFCALKENHTAMKYYNKSIACAKTAEALALAYGNRSAVFFEAKLYKQCLIDIEYALRNGYPKNLSEKLGKRKVKSKQNLSQSKRIEPFYTQTPKLSGTKNKFIKCASSQTEIKYSDKMGRHIVAKKKIEPGDVIAVEKPYASVLSRNHYQMHCYNCLNMSYNLIPCEKCTSALYCDEMCRETAWKLYHQYECCLIDTLNQMNAASIVLIALRIVLCARYEFCTLINNDLELMQQNNEIYQSARYKEIHNLLTHEEDRSTTEMFAYSLYTALLFHLLKSTKFFDDGNLNYEDMKKCTIELLFRHIQIATTNMHSITELLQSNPEYDYKETSIGCGIYSFLSLLNHSCVPNVTYHFYGSTVVLRATRHIESGQQLFSNYGVHPWAIAREERRQKLMNQYFFTCECIPCSNDLCVNRNMASSYFRYELIKANRDTAFRKLPKVFQNLKEDRSSCLIVNLLNEQIVKECLSAIANKHTLF